jgi:hypothetical protein
VSNAAGRPGPRLQVLGADGELYGGALVPAPATPTPNTNGETYSLLLIVLPFACVLAHEFGHILAARAFNIRTTDVTLGPIGGVARLDRIPEKLSEVFLVAIAGLPVNLTIAVALMAASGRAGTCSELAAELHPQRRSA